MKNSFNMGNKMFYTYKNCKTLEQMQRANERKQKESRGKLPGFSEEFIRPMWILPKNK